MHDTRIFCVYAYTYTRTYARIYVRICLFVMHPPSFFMRSIVWQTKDISGMKKREASTRNLHSVKNVSESLNILSFRLLHKFTDKLPFINNGLIFSCQKVYRKIETVAWFPYIRILFSFITCDVYFEAYGVNKSLGQRIIILLVVLTLFKRNDCVWLSTDSQLIMKRSEKSNLWNYKIEILCFARVGKWLVKLKCLLSEELRVPVKKIRTPVLFHKNRQLKRQK